jgi:hypothetical protein
MKSTLEKKRILSPITQVAESNHFLLFHDDKIEAIKLTHKKTGYFSAAG